MQVQKRKRNKKEKVRKINARIYEKKKSENLDRYDRQTVMKDRP